MIRLTIILPLILLGHHFVMGQTVESILGPTEDYMFRPASIRELPLFNAGEIKERNIRRCTIIEYSYNYNTSSAKPDTLHIYEFNKTGETRTDIRFSSYSSKKDTFYYQNSNGYYKKIDSSTTIAAGQKTVEKYYLWDYNWQKPEEIDTGIVVRKVYDNKNRLVELKSNGTSDYHQINFCGTGITYHYKYGYDDKNRLTFYDDAGFRYYALFKYTQKGIAVTVYNKRYEEKPRKYFVRVKKKGATMIEAGKEVTITLTTLSPHSTLFSELTERRGGKRVEPTVYQFIYEYHTPVTNQPANSIVSN